MTTSVFDALDRLDRERRWETLYPKQHGPWSAAGTASDGRPVFGVLDPASMTMTSVSPEADPSLPDLPAALDAGTLVAYRPHRRAVIRTSRTYIKVLRRKRWAVTASAHQDIQAVPGVTFPRVVRSQPGTVELSVVGGDSLHSLLAAGVATPAHLASVGRALARFHASSQPQMQQQENTHPDWIAVVAPLGSGHHPVSVPEPAAHGGTSPTHGDLHDKQLCIDAAGIGFIDLDGVRLGDPAEDIGNLIAHLHLRALQYDAQPPDLLAEAFLAGYGPHVDQERVDAYRRATLARLAILYQFRRRWVGLVPHLEALVASSASL